MWHDIASYSNFLENLIGDGVPNCDLYRGLFNLSAALFASVLLVTHYVDCANAFDCNHYIRWFAKSSLVAETA